MKECLHTEKSDADTESYDLHSVLCPFRLLFRKRNSRAPGYRPGELKSLIYCLLFSLIFILGCRNPGSVKPQLVVHSVEDLPEMKELPDPFLFANGQRVRNQKEWAARRLEIKDILLEYEYGRMPPAPDDWSARVISRKAWQGGEIILVKLALNSGIGHSLEMSVNVYRPAGDGPFPVVVNIGDDSSKAKLDLDRGFMMMTCSPELDLDPDLEGKDVVGPAQLAYPAYDWGALAVWAWSASRVMDYLETRDDAQTECVIVRGHSRMGKAALLAGAMDERFAMVAPNGSGTGGASVFRVRNPGAETLASISSTQRFASWFHKDFHRFGGRTENLPFDQHWLHALVAPRLLISTEAEEDRWANPLGSQAAFESARHVYRFLGVPGNIGLHIRAGDHENLEEDWNAMLEFAEWRFFGKTTRRRFDHNWDVGYSPTYEWGKPE